MVEDPPHARRVLLAAVLPAIVLSEGVAWMLGLSFDANSLVWLWQCLDPAVLRHDLLRGLYYLHGQPPLFNLFLGIMLKLFPGAQGLALGAAYQMMGAALLLALGWLMVEVGVPRWLTALLCTMFAVHPPFLFYSHWLFYPLPHALLLALTTVALARFLDGGRAGAAHAFAWLAGALMLSRAVFHPVWLLAAVATVVRHLDRERRRRLLVAVVAPLVVVNLWYAKNLALVGSYGPSSWLGMNLRKGLVLGRAEWQALMAEGRIPPVWMRLPFDPPEKYLDLGFFAPRPEAGFVHAVLDAPHKTTGFSNFNHRDYARIAHAMLVGDIVAIRARPGMYLQRVASAWWLFLQPGPRKLFGDRPRLRRFADAWSRVLLLGGLHGRDPQNSLNLLMLGYPAALLYGLVRALRPPAPGERDLRALFAFISLTILWAAVCSNLIEIGENDRLRFETDALSVVLLGAALAWRRPAPAQAC